jgi:cytochrome c-type biogenesis protein CcmH/NrfF
VLWLLAVLVLVVLGSWLVGTVLARRRNPAEVLRAGE